MLIQLLQQLTDVTVSVHLVVPEQGVMGLIKEVLCLLMPQFQFIMNSLYPVKGGQPSIVASLLIELNSHSLAL